MEDARANAHLYYDDCIFCPGFLSGHHMNSKCYLGWIEKKAQQILKNSKKDERRS